MNKKLVISLVVLVGLLLTGIGAALAYGYSLVNTQTIRTNVFIDEKAVGGLTYDQAQALISEEKSGIEKGLRVDLTHDSEEWTFRASDVQFKFDVKAAVDEAYAVGRSGNFISDLFTMRDLVKNKKVIQVKYGYDIKSVRSRIEEIAKDLNKPMKEATFKLGEAGPIITDDQVGRTVDVERSVAAVEDAVKAIKNGSVELVVEKQEPKMKADDLRKMTDRLAKFYTIFDTGYVERAHNVRLAASKVNGALVMPGEVISIDKQVGPRTLAKGFLNSKIIVNNKYEDGVGGGLCQVSTTLYNAALYANLEIVARKNHSIVSSYIAPGRDSTVFNSDKDLKIKNNRKYPIYIKSYSVGGYLHFEIYGKKEPDDKKIVIRTSVVSHTPAGMDEVEDPTMYVGKSKVEFEPHDGYVVKTYKDVYQDGKKLETVYLGLSTYNKSDGIKLVGTKAKPAKKAKPTPTPEPEATGETTGTEN